MKHGKRLIYTFVALLLFVTTIVQAHAQAAIPVEPEQIRLAPTYRIFATREGLVGHTTANGHVIQPRDRFVALPSWRNLSPRGSHTYQVRVTYKGRSVVLPVWDVGPWNTHDDYWSPDRERYRDLPVGMPMAQAAYLDGYNGGLDEFGRRIMHPNGIDIADGAFWDDLGMRDNDWVEVSFLWLGQDPGAGAAVSSPSAPAESVESDDLQPSAESDPPAAPEPTATPTPEPASVRLDNPAIEANAVAVDNDDAGYKANRADWETAPCGVNGDHASTQTTQSTLSSSNQASWTTNLPAAGTYEVKAYIPLCGEDEDNVTRSAHYALTHDGGETEVTLNQSNSVGQWASLGLYYFDDELDPTVTLTDLAGDDGRVVRFDAVKWVPRSDDTPPEARVTRIVREDNGFLVAWGGDDDASGIVTYDVEVRQLPSGGWRPWRRNTRDTEGWFGPAEGKDFAFRARARDRAGNEQPWQGDAADMDTTTLP
jgi:hypothetical protein